jgi:Ca-activated chloride channel family protein
VLAVLLAACFPAHSIDPNTALDAPDTPSAQSSAADTEAAKAEAAEGLRWAQALNGADQSSPPAIFRAGHVTDHPLPEEIVTRSSGRFEIKLPSGAPITTPAVYEGRLYTSGGFKGKEFYAFDAHTGAPAWGRNLDDDGPSAPACDDGVCVFNTESCTVFALDAATGEQRWSWWMGDPMLSAPAIADGIVYTSYPAGGRSQHYDNNSIGGHAGGAAGAPAGASHVLAALDLQTGELRWQRWIDGDVISSPVVADGSVHITTFSGTLFTFDADDGDITAARRGRATSAPTVANGDLYWSTRSEEGGDAREGLVAAGQGEGVRYTANERAAPYLDASVQSQTRYADDGMLLDAGNGFSGGAPAAANAGHALDNVGQGTVSRLQAYQGSKVLHAFDNNYATMGDEVVSTDPETGEVRWSVRLDGDLHTAGGFLAAPPAKAGALLVVATLRGDVLLLDPETGAEVRRISIGAPIRSQPLVWEGWLYVGTEDGRLIGVDTGDKALTGWPMWGGDAARSGA